MKRGDVVTVAAAGAIRRDRIGRRVGSLDEHDIARLNIALAFTMGLAD